MSTFSAFRFDGKRVLVVDDVVNTGLSVRQTVDAVRADGGSVVGVACLVHRGNVDAAGISVPEYVYLLEYDIPNWPAAECPLCKQGVPINVEFAHGRDFLDAQLKLSEQQHDLVVQKRKSVETIAAKAALEAQREQTRAEYERGVMTDLAEAEQKAGQLSEDIVKAEDRRAD